MNPVSTSSTKALRLTPGNFEAGALTAALLTQESWPVVNASVKHDGMVESAQFGADGQRVVTASVAVLMGSGW
jgi:hypothetical protein